MIAERAALIRRLSPIRDWKVISTPHGPLFVCRSGSQSLSPVDYAAMQAAVIDSIGYLEESAPD